ncbi:hypothetical protein [Ravibacter arvi]|uniref:hypothetical protein n=1 Tax=Ravibacter arvi TaxID=2051041 RepID=UPI0031EA8453
MVAPSSEHRHSERNAVKPRNLLFRRKKPVYRGLGLGEGDPSTAVGMTGPTVHADRSSSRNDRGESHEFQRFALPAI